MITFRSIIGPTLAASIIGTSALAVPAAGAKNSHTVKLRTTKSRTVTGPVKIAAVPRGRPKKVSFSLDGRRRYATRKAPYTFGGADGRFDPSNLKEGKHRITVRATFSRGRAARATTVFRVRKRREPVLTTTPTGQIQQTIVTTTVTKLPSATTNSTPTSESGASERALWDGSADYGFAPWGLIQDGLHDAQFGNTQVSIVPSPVVAGHKAFKFTSSPVTSANGPRAELADSFRLNEGDDFWFGDVLYIPGGQPLWIDGHHTVLQFKNAGTGSPPLALDVRDLGGSNQGLYTEAQEPGGQRYRLAIPMSRLYDRAIPIEIHVKFSSNPSVGEFEVWADGARVVGPVKMATLFAGLTSGLKQGQYGEQPGTAVYWQGAKRGASRASVLR